MPEGNAGRGLRVIPRGRALAAWFLLICIIALVWAGGRAARWYVTTRWAEIEAKEDQAQTKDFTYRFHKLETSIIRGLDSLHLLPELQLCFSSDDDSVQEALFFTRVLPALGTSIAVEVYDDENHLIGWSGSRGPAIRERELLDRTHTFVVEDQIYSYLVVSEPLRIGERQVGHLLGKRVLDVNYPINNRFINPEAFQTVLAKGTQFDLSEHAAATADSHYVSVELRGSDGAKLGYAYLARATLEERLRSIDTVVDTLLRVLVLAALLMAILYAGAQIRTPWRRTLFRIFGIWLVRYALVWTKLPSLIGGRAFDPVGYASPFGYGIAASIGDLLLSAAALFATAVLLARTGDLLSLHRLVARVSASWLRKAAAVLGVLAIAVLLAGLIRALCAIVRSTVFDSSVLFNDPSSLFPSGELALILLSLLLLSAGLILISVSLFSTALGLLELADQRLPRRWSIAGIIILGVGLSFGLLSENPLIDPALRAGLLICFLAAALVTTGRLSWSFRLTPAVTLIALFLGAALILLPLIDDQVHELDRLHVELVSKETSRPADSWLMLIVQRALAETSGKEAAAELAGGDSTELSGLAFREWAKSILGKEGNVCSVTYVGKNGAVVSDFHIGIPPHTGGTHRVIIPATSPWFHTEDRQINGRTSRWHVGYATLVADTGDTVGGVLVEVSGSRQSLLEGEAPEILRTTLRGQWTGLGRSVILAEYDQGRLTYASDDQFPLGRALPADASSMGEGGWLQETIDGRGFLTYYAREDRSAENSPWVALSIPAPDFEGHVVTSMRYLMFFLVILLIILAGRFLLDWKQAGRRSIGFRTKVFVALCVVALLPVAVLGYYNRVVTLRQSEEYVTGRLEEETSTIVSEVQRQAGATTPAAVSSIDDERCAQIATLVKTDFNLYGLRTILASSKPELFVAGVLDSRISADAYANIVIRKKRFYLERQQIGQLPYVIGYRPIVAEDGSTAGIVSVPTLYRQIEIDEELTRRDSLLYGVYTIVVLLSVVVGTVFANQISSPVRRLMEAARHIGSGRLDLPAPPGRTDELGQLEDAFHRMAGDLRRVQMAMRQTEREIAWREMAKQVAHEIKNPLTPMKLSIQHLRQAYIDRVSDFERLLQQVSDLLLGQIDTLTRIAGEFSQYARMPERRVTSCDVHTILREVIGLHEQESHAAFLAELNARQSTVRADVEELRRVFINLFRNALQAIPAKGRITVCTSNADGFLAVDIQDTGVGIPAENLERIFEPNFSTKSEGMGLGLSIVKQIVDGLHGQISIESIPGKGTTVHLQFPLANEEKEPNA